jgi:hypothetical protein
MINSPNDLWCEVLHSKYGRDHDLRDSIGAQSYHSPLWKVLAGVFETNSKSLSLVVRK